MAVESAPELRSALLTYADADLAQRALGSRDVQRFRADMGTVYLGRLGELLMAALVRHLVQAEG